MSIKLLFIIFSKSRATKCDGTVDGSSEIPKTFAPKLFNHAQSQEPLNPVWPVTRTFFP